MLFVTCLHGPWPVAGRMLRTLSQLLMLGCAVVFTFGVEDARWSIEVSFAIFFVSGAWCSVLISFMFPFPPAGLLLCVFPWTVSCCGRVGSALYVGS